LPPLGTLAFILGVMLFGFVEFTAAIAAEFLGADPLPRWSRACVPNPRGTTLAQHLWTTFVFVILTAALLAMFAFGVVMAIRSGDLVNILIFAAVVGGAVIWATYLWTRYSHAKMA